MANCGDEFCADWLWELVVERGLLLGAVLPFSLSLFLAESVL